MQRYVYGLPTRRFVAVLLCTIFLFAFIPIQAQATSTSVNVAGKVYEFAGKSNYDFSSAGTSPAATTAASTMGVFSISGEVKENGDMNGIPVYSVRRGNLTLRFTVKQSQLNLPAEKWHLIEDSSKNANGVKLDKKIGFGALILQTSVDGENWITDVAKSNVLTANSELREPFFTTKDVQLDNGCYYRIFVIYKMEIKTGEKKVGFVKIPQTEEKKVAEVYTFYAASNDPTRNITDSSATPRRELGQKALTLKDKGFDGNSPVDKGDPHFGWDLGTFIVNGYTRDTEDKGVPVFLKNVGDKVVLWFKLDQNINKLNGDPALSISEDTDGYDKYFEVDGTNFKHGTLIIQYTDKTGKRHTPVVYTDFLAANARTGADTRVQLFEEGDYEVTLDYEIKNSPRQIGSVSVAPTYTNYKIFFSFKIRNGNCMVYPFDTVSGNELSDLAWTADGFQLDMARSRYLTIDVQKSSLSVGSNGQVKEDVRFNRPAQDGESYTDEGIYVFSVKNLYTGESTTKTIYVGDNKFLRALSQGNMTLAALNEKIAAGGTVQADGSILMPTPTPKPTPTPTPKPSATPKPAAASPNP